MNREMKKELLFWSSASIAIFGVAMAKTGAQHHSSLITFIGAGIVIVGILIMRKS